LILRLNVVRGVTHETSYIAFSPGPFQDGPARATHNLQIASFTV